MKLLEPKFNSHLSQKIETEIKYSQSVIFIELQKKVERLEKQLKDLLKPKKLKVSTKDAVYFINFNDILFLKSESNYTYLYLTNGKKMLISKTLRFLSMKIDDAAFIRIHASYYINSIYLLKYIKSKNKIILENNIELPVSRRNKRKLTNWIDKQSVGKN